MRRLLPVLLAGAAALACARGPSRGVVRVTARRFAYDPSVITLRRGQTAVLELVALDRRHGFAIPALGLRADVVPGKPARVTLTPAAAGTFPFHCDLYCGSGHEDMTGRIVVVE